MRNLLAVVVSGLIMLSPLFVSAQQASLRLNDQEYLEMPGLNVMAFQDVYPEGHQGGASIIQNGVRVATNGDIRLDPTPGQWDPMPKQDRRAVEKEKNQITTWLSYPDPARNRTGSNPIDYPDLKFSYQVHVRGEGQSIRISVDLDQPLPAAFVGKIGFNLELYPTALFGKTWYLAGRSAIFPRQGNGPDEMSADGDIEAVPLATGRKLSIAPEVEAQRMLIESATGDLQLLDGRNKRNNGWFVVRSLVPAGATKDAIQWTVTPHAIPSWMYSPVVHVSQIGYHPAQKKIAIIELDKSDQSLGMARVMRIAEGGGLKEVASGKPSVWGNFLRYRYLQYDFTRVTQAGMYLIQYDKFLTQPFHISPDVYQRGVWQPVLEYFLPVQMCHMRVEQQYRVWHGACHLDDARMSKVDHNHFDGYKQGPSTLTHFRPGETVPGLNVGGWHDAGDDDLRIESRADEVSILAAAYESFHVDYDDTTIDEANRITKIHQPDGKPDILQQVEHGVLTILGGYRAMGRFYRGIIDATLPQYVILGDMSTSTDNLFYDASMKPGERSGTHSAIPDDRWVFTEHNPAHEYKAIAALAAAARVLKIYDPSMAQQCLEAARTAWTEQTPQSDATPRVENGATGRGDGFDERIAAAVELWLTTGDSLYGDVLLQSRERIVAHIATVGWAVARVMPMIKDQAFVQQVRSAVSRSFAATEKGQAATPFGVPYRPHIWGAGWDIQRFGVDQYFLHHAFPDIVTSDYMLNALNFVLGVHPGENTASFASGVGARSSTVAYGFNRADWSYVPGGVVSGTALIRPDFPELKDFPYLWQQMEYVLGGGSSNYMFLVLAANQVLAEDASKKTSVAVHSAR